jgi:hypothetical protein
MYVMASRSSHEASFLGGLSVESTGGEPVPSRHQQVRLLAVALPSSDSNTSLTTVQKLPGVVTYLDGSAQLILKVAPPAEDL